MGGRDPREVLGVRRDASADELRGAYRRLALRHHPDRNRGDAAAETRFKEVNEAYRILRKEAGRRAARDHLGHPTSGWGAASGDGAGARRHFRPDGGGIFPHAPVGTVEAGIDVPLEALVPGDAGARVPTPGRRRAGGPSRPRPKHIPALLVLLVGGPLAYAGLSLRGSGPPARTSGPATAASVTAPGFPEVGEARAGVAAAPAPGTIGPGPALPASAPAAEPGVGSMPPSAAHAAGPIAAPVLPAPDPPGAADDAPVAAAAVPAAAPASGTTPAPERSAAARAGPSAPPPPPVPPAGVPAAEPALFAALMRTGDAAMANGDVAAARARYERAAAVHPRSSAAPLSAGKTFDPGVLALMGVGNAALADAARARAWYERARALGDPEAADLLARLR